MRIAKMLERDLGGRKKAINPRYGVTFYLFTKYKGQKLRYEAKECDCRTDSVLEEDTDPCVCSVHFISSV